MPSLNLTRELYHQLVLESKDSILVNFWAPWSSPCRILSPVVEEVGEALQDRIKVAKVDVEALPEIGEKLNISSIPTLILFHGGKEAGRLVELKSKQEILDFIALA